MNKSKHKAPVITIDGPSGSGKGTIAGLLARHLNWHMLDSGALYRTLAFAILKADIQLDDSLALANVLADTKIQVSSPLGDEPAKIYCNGEEVSQVIRGEACGLLASQASSLAPVRQALLKLQQNARIAPGLVADGRDMGTVIFPDAEVKFYLDAALAERAKRRHQQLQNKGINVSLRQISDDLSARDEADRKRSISPTKPAPDAIVIDSSNLTIEQVFAKVLAQVVERLKLGNSGA